MIGCILLIAAIDMVQLHGPEGQQYWVNVAEISSLREPTAADLHQFARGAHCLVVTTNAKFLAVREACDDIHDKLMNRQ